MSFSSYTPRKGQIVTKNEYGTCADPKVGGGPPPFEEANDEHTPEGSRTVLVAYDDVTDAVYGVLSLLDDPHGASVQKGGDGRLSVTYTLRPADDQIEQVRAVLRDAPYGVEPTPDDPTVDLADCVRYLAEQRRAEADENERLRDTLRSVSEFVATVTAWQGNEDDLGDALGEIEDALAAAERPPFGAGGATRCRVSSP